jgi:hypothetical protein
LRYNSTSQQAEGVKETFLSEKIERELVVITFLNKEIVIFLVGPVLNPKLSETLPAMRRDSVNG